MNGDRISVVAPTYNEKENLPRLVDEVFRLGIPNLSMVIIDDNSPDGTGEVAEALSRTYPITVIHNRGKAGLGKAYVRAFTHLLEKSRDMQPNYIIQMDADLSHDPNIIPSLLEHIEDVDVVIGSRYVPGGAIQNWEYKRRLLSRFGNLYARVVLNLPYRDLTAGFKCYRKVVLERMDHGSLYSVGYNFQIETIYRAHHLGFKIKEIPITFTERKHGSSKMNFSIISESFFKVALLPFKEKHWKEI